jgi:hypothetical protein
MVVTLGQDLSEPFELYAPPAVLGKPLPPGGVPLPLGVSKPRGNVHRDGDWHRSVHVWLTDGACLLLQRRSIHKVGAATPPMAMDAIHGLDDTPHSRRRIAQAMRFGAISVCDIHPPLLWLRKSTASCTGHLCGANSFPHSAHGIQPDFPSPFSV